MRFRDHQSPQPQAHNRPEYPTEACGMIKYAVSRGGSTAKWIAAANARYSTSSTGGDAVLQPSSAITQAAPSLDEDQSLRRERVLPAEIRSSRQYKRRHLPLSPFMDPDVLAAREKHHLPKASPSKSPNAFQQQLRKNPYALALTTPVRVCQLTKIALPNYFLQDFGLMAHPSTKSPCYVPRSLTSKHTAPEPILFSTLPVHNATSEPSQTSTSGSSTIPNPVLPQGKTPFHGRNFYILARQRVLRSMPSKSVKGTLLKFASPRMRAIKTASEVLGKATWRSDMDVMMLELMRRRAVQQLLYLLERKRGYVVGCRDWEDAMKKPQVGIFLWTGSAAIEGEQHTRDEPDRRSNGPPEFATLVLGSTKQRKVPVHNLQVLLGQEHIQKLKEKVPDMFDNQILAVRHRRLTVDFQLQLWKLQGYLAQ